MECFVVAIFIGWLEIESQYVTIEQIDCGNKTVFIDKDTMDKLEIIDYISNTNTYIVERLEK